VAAGAPSDAARLAQNDLFALPVAAEQGLVLGRVVELPPPSTRLPREKPLPKPRPLTKWEAYAKTKGIVKRKRSARVWDEDQGEWRGRHGYRRVSDPDDVAIVEAKAWETAGNEDPFSKALSEKKSRVSAQAWRQAANEGRAGGGRPPAGGAGAPLGVVKSAAIARVSTASTGTRPAPRARRAPRRPSAAGGTGAVQPTAPGPTHHGGTLRRACGSPSGRRCGAPHSWVYISA